MSIHVSEVTPLALMVGIPLLILLIASIVDYRNQSKSKDKAVKAQAHGSKIWIIVLSILIAIIAFLWFFALKTAAGKKMFKNFIHK